VFVTSRRKIDEFRVCRLVDEIALIMKNGWSVVLVVSGAVAVGMRDDLMSFRAIRRLAESRGISRECEMPLPVRKRAAAGIGQLVVMNEFYRRFLQKNIHCAQLLLTKESIANSDSKDRLREVLQFYLHHNIIPIINENDVVDLYSFGGNDELAYAIAKITNAQQLLILSSFTSHFGIGGGTSKTQVLEKAQKEGISATIADGKKSWIHLIQN